MMSTFFPKRRFFEYDRHALFTYELVNEIHRLTKKENMTETSLSSDIDIEFVEKVSAIIYGDFTHQALKKQHKGMIK